MARIRRRPRADGGTSYQVTWVLGGGQAVAGSEGGAETFTTEAAAKRFVLDVAEAGEQWPPGWVKGKGYVKDATGRSAGGVPTVDEVAEDYWVELEKRVRRGSLERDTLHKYKRIWALHISEHLGHLPITEVTPSDVEAWVDAMIDEPASPKSIRNWHGLLHPVLGLGATQQKTGYNPAGSTDLPRDDRRARRQVVFVTHDEWRDSLRPALDPDAHLIADVLLATGARWGEVSALLVSDVSEADDGDIALHIRQAWGRRAPEDPAKVRLDLHESKKYRLKTTKSGATRYAVISGELADRVRAAAADRPGDQYLLGRQGPWRYEDFHYEKWAPAVRQANLGKKVTIHGLRHSFVVWSLAAGVSLEKVSDLVGHASIQITHDIYGGLLNLRDPQAARAMAKVMAG